MAEMDRIARMDDLITLEITLKIVLFENFGARWIISIYG